MSKPQPTMQIPAACGCGSSGTSDWPLSAILNWIKGGQTMAQDIKKSAKDMVKAALSTVPAISVEDALGLVDTDTHVFVDLRDGTEQARTGLIPGAIASSRGMMEFQIDPENPAHKPAFNQDKTYVFYCASGGRSALAARVAMDMGLAPVVNLSGGVAAWKKVGGPLKGDA
jgi:rhodanese-related sulfurtransferase